MTPDLQRLCAAAETASGRDDIELTPDECEAIVRAVLTALREPSEGMVTAGGLADDDRYETTGVVGDTAARASFSAMIDHILTP